MNVVVNARNSFTLVIVNIERPCVSKQVIAVIVLDQYILPTNDKS